MRVYARKEKKEEKKREKEREGGGEDEKNAFMGNVLSERTGRCTGHIRLKGHTKSTLTPGVR